MALGLLVAPVELPQLCQCVLVDSPEGELRGKSLQGSDDRIELDEVANGLFRDTETSMGDSLEESLGRQPSQRFPNRGSAHAEPITNFLFAGKLSGCYLPGEDPVAECFISPIRKRGRGQPFPRVEPS